MTMSRTDAVHESTPATKWPGLVAAFKHLRGELIHLLGFSFAMNLLVLAVPIFMIQVFDRVLTSHSMETLTLLALATVAALLVMAVLDVIRGRILVRSAGVLERSLSADLVANGHFNRYTDIAKLRNFLNGPALTTCLDMPWVPLFIGLIFIIHPALGWIALSGAAVMVMLAYFSERLTRSNVIASRHADDFLGNLTHQMNGHVQSQGCGKPLKGLSDTWQLKQYDAIAARTVLLDRLQTSAAIGRFLRLVLQIALISGAAVLVTTGQLTAGGMIAASVIAARALGPIERAQEAWRTIVDARAQLSRLAKILIPRPQPNDGFPVFKTPRLDVEGLAYIAPSGARPVFSNVSLQLEGGEMLGVSGSSDSGKSTLARLLVGFDHPTQGRIRFNKQDVSDIGHDSNIAYLSQSATLLPGTIAQNIARFAEISLDQIHYAALLAGVDDAILDLPHGYETQINPNYTSLSAGIAQRIKLARVYCQQPSFLVLDEPYTHLDNAGVSSLLSALNQLRDQGCVIVVISQRPSLLAQCDKVMILQDGIARIVGKRKKAELTVFEGTSPENEETQPVEAAQ